MDAERPTLRIEDIVITEARRGEGLDAAIIGAVRDFCAAQGFDLNLSANLLEDFADPGRETAMKWMISYYERLGFVCENGQRDGNMVIEAEGPGLVI